MGAKAKAADPETMKKAHAYQDLDDAIVSHLELDDMHPYRSTWLRKQAGCLTNGSAQLLLKRRLYLLRKQGRISYDRHACKWTAHPIEENQ